MSERAALKQILDLIPYLEETSSLSFNEIEERFADIYSVATKALERPYDPEKCKFCSKDPFDPDTPCKRACLNGCQGDEFDGKPSHCSGLC